MLTDFTDKELADMVRNCIYAKNARFEDSGATFSARFLLVLAIPYGKDEGVDSLPEAIAAFAEFLQDDDWKERSFQIYDHQASQKFFEASMEEVEAEEEVE